MSTEVAAAQLEPGVKPFFWRTRDMKRLTLTHSGSPETLLKEIQGASLILLPTNHTPLDPLEVGQVVVILQPMTPLLECQDQGQKPVVEHIVVALCR